ncbi:hypothetical protein BROUX41_003676 [Berkeleyomyces rouxiae]|uniref:uncharacterized protein n=1 Tax=Berkeleyomyces rouxiae TaxID=2035830 RepID=UPI003B800F5B
MTAVSLDHGDVFEEVVGAAHMIAHSRNAAWPRLYVTSIRAFLENKRFGEARDWHIKLMPMFDPGPQAFASIMTSFAPNLDPQCQAALRSIYSHSNYRDLYDKVVPLLHRQGKENAARDWRSLFLQYHDRPRSAVSGPFVRFLSQYFPDEGLCEEELMVSHPSFTPQSLAQQPSSPESTESETYAKPPPNDRLIARWFASEWTSIEFSFTVIHKLGVRRIGSASLQSLGLRCESSLELLACVKDLKALGITVTQSNYTNAVLRIARSKTDDQLFELLKSDVHPDVFEDIPTLRKILAASTAAGDWKKHRLFTTILAHLNEDATPKLYRDALLRCFKGPWRWASALRLLNNATCNNVKIRLSAFNTFMNAIVDDAKKRSSNGLRAHTSVVVSICLNAMERGYAVPCQIWSIILSSLSRTGQIQEIESIGNELIAHYTRLQYTGKSIRIHSSDAAFRKPESLKRHSRTSFPASTSFSNKYHPLRLIFNERVVMDILSSGFRSPLSRPAVALADTMSVFSKQPLPPSAFGPATGVRLLRILHDRGVPIQRGFVQSAIVYAALDWKPKPWKIKYHLLLTTSWRAYSLQDIKIMCDKAWGSEILPDIATFQDMVQEARAQIVENKRMRDEEYKKIARNVYGRRI